ncbi:MAG TPA: hypothetical protein VF848_04180 [Steroidobacteraceae bacterium]
MELFWLLAGVLITLATLVLLLPWLRTIPRLGPLPAVPRPLAIGAAAVLVVVLVLYRWIGHPEQAVPAASGSMATASAAAGAAAPGKAAAGSMNSAIAGLEARLAKSGGSADDWELLARSFEFLGRPADAAKARAHQLPPLPVPSAEASATPNPVAAAAPVLSADSLQWLTKAAAARRDKHPADAAAIYAQLAKHDQLNADGWADYADTAATLQGGKLAGAPESYVDRALALDPQHAKALWLKASAAEEAGHFDAAVGIWQRLQPQLAPNSADAKIVAANLQQDQKLAASASAAPAASGAVIRGEVALDRSLSSKVTAGATLFIIAKSVGAPGPPVAVYRGTVGSWPVKFTLDDSLAMMPGRNLSSAGQVTVEARISSTGQALPASGDLHSQSTVVNPADHPVLKLLIDRVIS